MYAAPFALLGFAAASLFHGLAGRSAIASYQRSTEKLHQRLEELQDRAWELRESEERHRSLAEAFGDLMMRRDANGKILYVNEAFASTFGLDTENDLGKVFEDKFLEEKSIYHDLTRGNLREVKVDTESGTQWFSWLDLPIRDETTGADSIRTVARDITRQKQIELELREATQAAQAMTEMVRAGCKGLVEAT